MSLNENLKKHAEIIKQPGMHLKNLTASPDRFKKFSLKNSGIFYDFSRQRITRDTLKLLHELADRQDVLSRFCAMTKGARVNVSENRAALHTALRDSSGRGIFIDGHNIMPEINKVKQEVRDFSGKIKSGEIKGSTGKMFTDAVVIGIGGSSLGTEFAANALWPYSDGKINLHFLSNVDESSFRKIISGIKSPGSTLWIVISKSYTTSEVIANTKVAFDFMTANVPEPSAHFVTVTSKGSPGDGNGNYSFKTFHMFDYIGGRYSVTSAVGAVPLSLFAGYDNFEKVLAGACEMDVHAANSPVQENIPLTAALLGIWNSQYLGYPFQAIIPYSDSLRRLPAHIQQLYMESIGKSVSLDNTNLQRDAGVVVFGEPGTNAQHSFFQMTHQGRSFPVEFIGIVSPPFETGTVMSKGVSNHQELWANMIAQAEALAAGSENHTEANRRCPGNTPSSIIVLNDISPTNIGRLLSFYEAKTVFEGFLLGINPFDQFGVELGKNIAGTLRKEMAEKNESSAHSFNGHNPSVKFYLETLFKGAL